jgi:hypothetical protein
VGDRLTPAPPVETRDQWHGIDPEDPAFGHIVRTLASMASHFGFDPHDEDIVRRATERGRRLHRFDQERDAVWREVHRATEQPDGGTVVYYVRIGNRCKIGYSTNLRSRLATFNPEELLVIEPGGRVLEQRRHHEFRELHTHGEWFRYEGALEEHVTRLREQLANVG